jgi:hypothetical protein
MKKSMRYSFMQIILFTAILFVAQSANALTVNVIQDSGNFIDSSQSGAGALDLAVDFDYNQPVIFNITLDNAERGSPVDFSGVIQNLSPYPWQSFKFSLSDGATFSDTSDITPYTADLGDVMTIANMVTINFANINEEQGFEFGTITPWSIDLASLESDNSFNLVLEPSAVPVPSALWLLVTGIFGLVVGRRKKSEYGL